MDQESLEKMLEENNAVVFSGGTSTGEGDFVYRAMESENPGIIFHGVAVKPGTPIVLAVSGAKPTYGLPGFPVSPMMIFRTVFLPPIELMSREKIVYHTVEVTIGVKTLIRVRYTSLVILRLVKGRETIYAFPVSDASGSVSRLLDAEGFEIIEGDKNLWMQGKESNHIFSRSYSLTPSFLEYPTI
ncbi:MAG: molybdopterin-binding protein [Candidatus Parvarchaeota archaeon]